MTSFGLVYALVSFGFLLAAGQSAQSRPDELVRAHRASVGQTDSIAKHAELQFAITEFHMFWQAVWRESERTRFALGSEFLRAKRSPYMHCHWSMKPSVAISQMQRRFFVADFQMVARPDTQYKPIVSADSAYAVCPTWMLAQAITNVQDETLYLDGAIMAPLRRQVADARAQLLSVLDSAGRASPADGWIAGQRVRFHLDQRDPVGASLATDACRAERWWCLALSGYLAHTGGNLRTAEARFAEMRGAMPARVRCGWSDWKAFYPENSRPYAEELSCSAVDSLETRLWWLADPLYRDAGNDRMVEQDARRVLIRIRQGNAADERFMWEWRRGGDAIAELMTRYGWPTYVAWGGDALDVSHNRYLALWSVASNAPYVTFEYTSGRTHTLPAWRALANPFDAASTDWDVNRLDGEGATVVHWWPREHFRPVRALEQFPDMQVGMFRRQDQVLLAASVELTPSSLRSPDAPLGEPPANVDMLLLASSSPSRVDSIAEARSQWSATSAIRGLIPSTPAIISLEARCMARGCGDARSRFGVTPPPVLASMRAGDVAISDPVLLDESVLSAGAANARDPQETMLDHLRPSTRLSSGDRRVGVYWETYGIKATDTVMVAIRVASAEATSMLRRLGVAVRVASDPRSEVQITWKEPDVAHSTRILNGPVPVQIRMVMLDLRELLPGSYVLETSVQRPKGVVVRGQRTITLY